MGTNYYTYIRGNVPATISWDPPSGSSWYSDSTTLVDTGIDFAYYNGTSFNSILLKQDAGTSTRPTTIIIAEYLEASNIVTLNGAYYKFDRWATTSLPNNNWGESYQHPPPSTSNIKEINGGSVNPIKINDFIGQLGYSENSGANTSKYYVLYALYTQATTYTVSYDKGTYGGGNAIPSSIKIAGSPLKLTSSTYSRTGYTQTGWSTSDGGSKVYDLGGQYTTDANRTLFPYWTPNQYIITFEKQKGEGGTTSTTVTFDALLPSINPPTRDGYAFAGYYANTGGAGTQYYDTTGSGIGTWNVADDTSLYASWIQLISITYHPGSGDVTGSKITDYKTSGESITLRGIGTYSRVGYTLAGWALSDKGAKAYDLDGTYSGNADINLFPYWTAITYSVRFNANGGSGNMSNQTMTYGVTVSLSGNTFTRDGYTFAGWATTSTGQVEYTDEQSVSNLSATQGAIVDLYAQWNEIYTVTYNPGTGTNIQGEITTVNKYKDQNLTLAGAIFSRIGYTQTGWASSDGGSQSYALGGTYSANANATLFPVWSQSILIYFNLQGGNVNGETSIASKTAYPQSAIGTLPSPNKQNYSFAGWYTQITGGTLVTSSTTAGTTDMVLYARWTGVNITITFDPSPGTCSEQSRQVSYGMPIGNLPKATRADYGFIGWFTASTGGTQIEANYIPTSSHTVYAQWRTIPSYYLIGIQIIVTVKFDANEGTVSEASRNVVQGEMIGTLPVPTRTGWDFDGWYTAEEGGTQISSTYRPMSSQTVFAHWSNN